MGRREEDVEEEDLIWLEVEEEEDSNQLEEEEEEDLNQLEEEEEDLNQLEEEEKDLNQLEEEEEDLNQLEEEEEEDLNQLEEEEEEEQVGHVCYASQIALSSSSDRTQTRREGGRKGMENTFISKHISVVFYEKNGVHNYVNLRLQRLSKIIVITITMKEIIII